jgi:hypothetical protein
MLKNKIDKKALFYWLVLFLSTCLFGLIIWSQVQIYNFDPLGWPQGDGQYLLH